MALLNREIDDIQSEAGWSGVRGQRESRITRAEDKNRIYEDYLGREQEKFRALEEFCDMTVRENHRLLLDVLSISKESDLRSLLAIQAKVIDRLLEDRARERDQKGSYVNLDLVSSKPRLREQATQTECAEMSVQHKILLPDKSMMSRKNSIEKDTSFSQYGVKGPSYQELDLYLLPPQSPGKNKYLRSTHGMRDDGLPDHYSFNLDRQPTNSGHHRWNTIERSKLAEVAPQPTFEELANPINQTEDLLEGSPFDDIHNINTENLLLFEDMEPSKGIRKSKTEVAFIPASTEGQEDSPFRKMLKAQDRPGVEITHFDMMSKIQISNSMSDVEAKEEGQGLSMRDDTLKSIQSKIEKEETRVSEYLDRMKQLRELYANKAGAGKPGAKTTVNSPVLAKAFRQRSSQKQIPIKLDLETEKKSVFEELNFNQFLKDKSSPVKLGHIQTFGLVPDLKEEKKVANLSSQHILRPRDARKPRSNLRQEQRVGNKNSKQQMELRKSINPKPMKASPSKSSYNVVQSKSQGICYNISPSTHRSLGKSEDIRKTSLWPRHFNPFSEGEPTCDKFSRLKVNNYSFHIHY